MVMLSSIELEPVRIPFRQQFDHNTARRSQTDSVLVTAISSSGTRGYGEGCPRPYVSGESLASARRFLAQHRCELINQIDSIDSLLSWTRRRRTFIDANPAAWCAIEIALLDLLGKELDCSIEQLLSLPRLHNRFHYSAVLGDSCIETFKMQLSAYRSLGLTDFKLKLGGELAHDRSKLACFEARSSVRADANNLWTRCRDAASYLRALEYPLSAIEEALTPAGRLEDLRRLARATGIPQVLDESLLRIEQLDELRGDSRHWVVNVRISKLGGILRSLDLVDRARARGLKIIVGAHVGETSILTRAALPVAMRAGEALLAQEGAFGSYLLSDDPCVPTLMFGAGGVLDLARVPLREAPGLGFSSID